MYEDERQESENARIAGEARDWLVRLTSGDVTENDLGMFRRWQALSPAHGAAFERERAFWGALGSLERGHAAAVPARGPTRRMVLAGGLAAGIGGAAVAMRVDLLWQADFRTSAGERRQATLPDGTSMLMNTDTAVALDFADGSRRVRLLHGEAQFDVADTEANSFEVGAAGGTTATRGASFAVKALDGAGTVTVAAGQVTLRASGPFVDISAGEQARYAEGDGRIALRTIDVAQALAWREGRIILDGTPFATAIGEIGRYVAERVVVANSSRDGAPVSGVFSTSQAAEALGALAAVQGLSMRRVPGILILIS